MILSFRLGVKRLRSRILSRQFGLPVLLLVVSACSAVGVIATSDPREKIAQANTMEEIGRLAVARRLILEAAEIYKEQEDELGLAEAYRRYAFFVRVNGEDVITKIDGAGQSDTPPPVMTSGGIRQFSISKWLSK